MRLLQRAGGHDRRAQLLHPLGRHRREGPGVLQLAAHGASSFAAPPAAWAATACATCESAYCGLPASVPGDVADVVGDLEGHAQAGGRSASKRSGPPRSVRPAAPPPTPHQPKSAPVLPSAMKRSRSSGRSRSPRASTSAMAARVISATRASASWVSRGSSRDSRSSADGEHQVAAHHRHDVAPARVHRGPAAAEHAGVHHVVVQEAGGVDELRGHAPRPPAARAGTPTARAEEAHQHGAGALAAAAQAQVPRGVEHDLPSGLPGRRPLRQRGGQRLLHLAQVTLQSAALLMCTSPVLV